MFKKIVTPITIILCISALLRFVWLDRVPTGVVNDELDYILNAKALFLTGSDISHTWNPFSFTTPKSSYPQAEIAPLLTFWIIGPLPLSPFVSKLPYVIISIWLVVLIYLITKKFVGSSEAFAAGLVAAINPWLIFFGRTAYDSSLSITALLSGLYVLLITRGWNILWAFPLFVIGFYGYIGSKLLFIPFLFITVGYSWFVTNKKKYSFQYGVLLLLGMIVFGSYVLSQLHMSNTRMGELSTPFMSEIVQLTNSQRKLTIQNPLTSVVANKFTVYARYSMEKYIGAFSTDFLLLHGDGKAQFTVREHGVFYTLDAIFFLIGLCVLYKEQKKVFCLIGALILIAPIPSVLSTVGISYAVRSFLLAPLFIVCIGVGIHEIVSLKRNKVYTLTASLLITVLYGVLLFNFMYIYIYRNPIYNSESSSFSGRVLSKYLSFTEGPVYIVNGDPRVPLKQYLFYTNGYTRQSAPEIAGIFQKKEYQYNRKIFLTCEQASAIPLGSLVIYDDPKCVNIPAHDPPLIIGRLDDGGTILNIINDSVCNQFSLKRYPYGMNLSDFVVEKLSQRQLCETFITKY